MDSYEIAKYMRLDEKIREQFYGIYSLDLIPKKLPIPSLVIVNLDYSTDKGSHWVVLHRVNNEVVEQFDSAGKQPKRDIVNNLFSNALSYKYNNKRVQNYQTDTCGLFCLYYSYHSSRGRTMQSILSDFSVNLKSNEEMIIRFFNNNFVK